MAEAGGLQVYAFADVRPEFIRDKDDLTMTITFKVAEAPRVYVERVDINGNTRTKDKVIRREFRLAEGDAFNSFKVKRSRDRIQRSEEHTSELQSLMRISYAVFCLKNKKNMIKY